MTTPAQPPHATFAPQPTAPTAPAAKTPWYGKRRVLLPATAVVFFAMGAAGSSKPVPTTTAAKPSATVTVTAPGTAAPAATTTVTVTETAQPAPPSGTISGDGTYEVGSDMKPGKYKTKGPKTDSIIPNCYWERSKGDGVGSIIANDNLSGQGVVTVKEGETFKSSGCQDWTPAS